MMEFVFLLMLFISPFGEAILGKTFWKIRERVEESRQIKRQQGVKGDQFPKINDSVRTIFITQPLDHFNPVSQAGLSFHQRVFVNEEYFDHQSGGPVFLFIGGEGALNSYYIQGGFIAELARKAKALIVAAEHRFYGASINSDGLKLESLHYLSSQQALADLAEVHRHITKAYQLKNSPWVSFGGSYAGALSAWYRLKYPHLVHAALASSGPVHAVTNFQGYNEVVANSLSDKTVGGSIKCLTQTQEAFKQVDKLLKGGSLKRLQKDFNSCQPLTDPLDQQVFVGNLAGNFEGVVQYNKEIPGMDIAGLCSAMTSSSDSYTNLVNLNKEVMNTILTPCMDNSYNDSLKAVKNTVVNSSSEAGVGIRQWFWQTCTQFGYYQTCDPDTTCPFSHHIDLTSQIRMCQDVFKISPSNVPKFVNFTNDYYGGNKPKGSRIVFSNGSIDPWHALGVLTTLGDTEIAVFINGTAHCDDLSPSSSLDPPSLKEARQEIQSILFKWIQEYSLKRSQ